MGIVNFDPKQEGAGDPSPTNVRPIHPGLTIDGIGDIYGGYVDFENAEVVQTYGYRKFVGSEDWFMSGAISRYCDWRPTYLKLAEKADGTGGLYYLQPISDKLKGYKGYATHIYECTINESGNFYFGAPEALSTKDATNAWIQEIGGINVLWELKTPITYSLTASQLTQAYNQLVPVSPVMLARRRRMIAGCDPELPPSYRRVEYIQAKNTAYIATNYIPTRYDEFDVEFMIDNYPSSFISLFSAGTDTYQLVYLLSNTDSGYSYLRYFSTNASGVHLNLLLDTWYRLTLSANGLMSINGFSKNYSYKNEVSGNNNNMYIFRRRDTSNPFMGKLKSFKVTNDGILKLNLVPCVRISNDVSGVYDTVSKTFYPSASTAEAFTPGRTMY